MARPKKAVVTAAPAPKEILDCALYAEGWQGGNVLYLQGLFTRAEARERAARLATRGLEVVLWAGLTEGAERTIVALGRPGVRTVV